MRRTTILFAIILLFIAVQSVATAVDCDKCRSMYESLKVMGYSEEECREGTLMYDSDCADCFSWGSSGSDSGSSSSSNGGECCGATAAIILTFGGVFIVYYGKKREMKR